MSNLHCGDGDVLLCGDVARGDLEELVDVVDEGEDDEDGHVDPALALHFKDPISLKLSGCSSTELQNTIARQREL